MRLKALNFDNFDNSHNSFLFHWFFMWKMDPMADFDIRLVYALPPRDSTLQYTKFVHLWNNFPCIITLVICIHVRYVLFIYIFINIYITVLLYICLHCSKSIIHISNLTYLDIYIYTVYTLYTLCILEQICYRWMKGVLDKIDGREVSHIPHFLTWAPNKCSTLNIHFKARPRKCFLALIIAYMHFLFWSGN